MNREQFMEYIQQNFNISGETHRLINNMLYYVENNFTDKNEQFHILFNMLDNTIGLTYEEIEKINL